MQFKPPKVPSYRFDIPPGLSITSLSTQSYRIVTLILPSPVKKRHNLNVSSSKLGRWSIPILVRLGRGRSIVFFFAARARGILVWIHGGNWVAFFFPTGAGSIDVFVAIALIEGCGGFEGAGFFFFGEERMGGLRVAARTARRVKCIVIVVVEGWD